ncbi:MAG: aldo/keto reductase [Bacteroidales bacterium]|jgi:predicted aldo/keto reductase-like oxidoreductase|nr:aldo/keto reductase [Bacteroidales bacterium]
MLYRYLGNTGKKISGLGIGTNRFAFSDVQNEDGYERAANVIVEAVHNGINYIDCGHTYSFNKAETIVGIALEKIEKEVLNCYTSTKVMYSEDKNETAVQKRIESSLKVMGINNATFGFAWRVDSYDEFLKMIEPGGLYTGLKNAQKNHLIEHICFSSHASPEDTIKIINTGMFEACMISCNILNIDGFNEVLKTANIKKTGVFTMNSLGGGVLTSKGLNIKQYLQIKENESQAKLSLQYLYAHEEITCCLSSMENIAELNENIGAFEPYDYNTILDRFKKPIKAVSGFCTKCRYCGDCPAGIPVCDMMYAYSSKLFTTMMEGYGNNSQWKSTEYFSPEQKEKQITMKLFNPRFYDYIAIPVTANNPCLKCGKCEKKCTQKLPIISRIDEIFDRSKKAHYSQQQRKERLENRLNMVQYKKVCFFPAGKYTEFIIDDYLKFFGAFPFSLYICDKNIRNSGNKDRHGIQIITVAELEKSPVDYILITNYNYGNEIYQQLMNNKNISTNTVIEKLHELEDIPWY